MGVLLEIVGALIEMIVCLLFFSAFLTMSKMSTIRVILLCATMAFIGMFLSFIISNNLLDLLVTNIVLLLTTFIIFEGSAMRKFLIMALYIFLSMITEVVVGVVMFNITNYDNTIVESLDYDLMIAFSVLFIKLLFVIWLKLTRNRKQTIDNNRFYILQSIIPIFSVIFLMTFLNVRSSVTNFYILILILVVINIVQYIIYGQVEDMYIDKYENSILEQRNEYLSEHIRIVENNIDRIKVMKHEIKNHLLTIRGMMQKDVTEAIKEIDRLVCEASYTGVEFYTYNSGINALLNTKYNNAINDGIDIKYHITILQKIKYIEDKDITAILGNLLDNAIEACHRVEGKKYIDFSMHLHKNSLLIKLENSTDGKTINFETQKKDKEFHGLGMKIIKGIIKKYHGNYEWYFKENYFYTEILLWDNKL